MKFSRDNIEDLEFIENLYENLESGFRGIGKKYTRPDDYIDRALRIMNESRTRNRIREKKYETIIKHATV